MFTLDYSVVSGHISREGGRIGQLLTSFARLEQQTVWSLEIYDSNHNKAIFIFGVVALIFLPLSFFTSYFGMNTFDIRDTESSQGDFWKVALPISAGVVGLTIIVAYYGEAIREWLSSHHEPSHAVTPATGPGMGTGYPGGRTDTIFPPPAAAPETVVILSKQTGMDRMESGFNIISDRAPRMASPGLHRTVPTRTLEEDQNEDGHDLNDEYEGRTSTKTRTRTI